MHHFKMSNSKNREIKYNILSGSFPLFPNDLINSFRWEKQDQQQHYKLMPEYAQGHGRPSHYRPGPSVSRLYSSPAKADLHAPSQSHTEIHAHSEKGWLGACQH